MSVLSSLKNAMFLQRTKYHAMVEGKDVTGCGDCKNNHPFPGILPFAPTRKCIISTNEENGDFMTIFDPFNVPEQCPLKYDPDPKIE